MGLNYEVTKKLAEKLELNVPISEQYEPISALGSMFWFRPKALKKLLDYPWTYEEMPREPVAEDGTILHAIERIHGYAAQSEGYYSGYLLCDQCAAIELTNLEHMVRTLNGTLFSHGCASGRLQGVNLNLTRSLDSLMEMQRHQDQYVPVMHLKRAGLVGRAYRKARGAAGKVKRGIKKAVGKDQ